MIKMTQSFSAWLFKFHKDIYGLVSFGHIELITEQMMAAEGRQYLKGGSKYREVEDK